MVGLLFVVPIVFRRGFKYEWQAALGFTLKIKHLGSGALKIKHLGRVGLIFFDCLRWIGSTCVCDQLVYACPTFPGQAALRVSSPHRNVSDIHAISDRINLGVPITHHILYICMYVCTYIHMYVCIHICTRLGFVCPVHAHKACDTLPDGNYICSPKARRVVLKASSICGLHM